jgi:hypothetical protein
VAALMARETPAYLDAKQDRALRGSAYLVYLWFDEHLDTVEYRYVKHATIERDLEISDSSVAVAITLLIGRGYLERGPRDGRVASYRLFHSRSSPKAIPHQTGVVVAR